MSEIPTDLLDAALTAADPAERRRAFVALAGSDDWRLVLAPHVLSRQAIVVKGRVYPDWLTFRQTAAAIADHAERIDHALALAGTRFSDQLLFALAAELGPELVTPGLVRLGQAGGPQIELLADVIQAADPGWVARSEADPVVARLLSAGHGPRARLIRWLAAAGALDRHRDTLRRHPPVTLEEWGAVGRAGFADPVLIDQALAILPYEPSPIAFLLRLSPVPEAALPRIRASARPTWASAALEAAILDGLRVLDLVPLAEIALRAGGRPQAVAGAWINNAGLGRHLLAEYLRQVEAGGMESTQRIARPVTPERVLRAAHRGEPVDWRAAADLARQSRDEAARSLVREILETPLPSLEEPVLHHLCAVCSEAAVEVERLARHGEPEAAARARACLRWRDVVWPEEGAVAPAGGATPPGTSAASGG